MSHDNAYPPQADDYLANQPAGWQVPFGQKKQ